MRTPPREPIIKMMRENGRTYQYIGDRFGISRQRVYQVINGYRYRRNKEKNLKA